MTADLKALLARVEAAEGADRELDGDLWLALDHDAAWAKCGWHGFVYAGERFTKAEKKTFIRRSSSYQSPNFTALLDAALALCERVLPGAVRIDLQIFTAASGTPSTNAEVWPDEDDSVRARVRKIPALALLAALLKAKIAEAESAKP